MGLRRWLRQFYVKVREGLGLVKDYDGLYDDLDCWAYFADGSSWHWEGRPWGSNWERYRAYIEDHANRVVMNKSGSFYTWKN